MKNTCLILIICGWLPGVVNSQSSPLQFGLAVGAGYSTVDYQNKFRPDVENSVDKAMIWRFSPGITGYVRHDPGGLVSLQGGLGVALTGNRARKFVLRTSTPDMPEPVRVGESWGWSHFLDLQLPMSVRIRPGQRFYITAGLTPYLKLGRWRTIRIDYDSGEKYRETDKLPVGTGLSFKKFNLGGDLGFGFYVADINSARMYVEPLFRFTFFPVYEDDGMGKGRVLQAGVNFGVDF